METRRVAASKEAPAREPRICPDLGTSKTPCPQGPLGESNSPPKRTTTSPAYCWYEEREIGLGEEFLRAIAARISLILRHPEMFPVALDNVRRAILRRFPYEIFYEVVENDLIVHAAFACSQDPERWKQRLRTP